MAWTSRQGRQPVSDHDDVLSYSAQPVLYSPDLLEGSKDI